MGYNITYLHFLFDCYMHKMKICAFEIYNFLQKYQAIYIASLENQCIASCRKLVTRCSFRLQFAMVSKITATIARRTTKFCFEQSFQTQNVAREVLERTCYTLQLNCSLSHNSRCNTN